MKKLAWALAPVVAVSAVAGADEISYLYNGTVGTNTPWSSFHGKPVEVLVTINLDTIASQTSADRKQYDGAVTGGYFDVDGIRFPFVTDGRRNRVIVRTDVFDINSGLNFNQYVINISTDGVDRAPFSFPGEMLFSLFDFDSPADTVLDLDLDQPLNTLRTQSTGGVDRLGIALGVAVGSTFSSVTSGDGGIRVVPAPGSALLLAGAGLMAARRKR